MIEFADWPPNLCIISIKARLSVSGQNLKGKRFTVFVNKTNRIVHSLGPCGTSVRTAYEHFELETPADCFEHTDEFRSAQKLNLC